MSLAESERRQFCDFSFFSFKGNTMRTLLSIAVLMAASLPAVAGGGLNPIPEPESLSLLAIAAVALIATRRIKK